MAEISPTLLYAGRHGDQVGQIFGLSTKVVIGLTWTLQHAGHVIYTDNFYTSPVLVKYMFSKDAYLCGTVRPDRKGFPHTLVQKKRDIKRLDRGHTEWKECDGMVATAWKDQRMVYYISTFHAPEQPVATERQRHRPASVSPHRCRLQSVHGRCRPTRPNDVHE